MLENKLVRYELFSRQNHNTEHKGGASHSDAELKRGLEARPPGPTAESGRQPSLTPAKHANQGALTGPKAQGF